MAQFVLTVSPSVVRRNVATLLTFTIRYNSDNQSAGGFVQYEGFAPEGGLEDLDLLAALSGEFDLDYLDPLTGLYYADTQVQQLVTIGFTGIYGVGVRNLDPESPDGVGTTIITCVVTSPGSDSTLMLMED